MVCVRTCSVWLKSMMRLKSAMRELPFVVRDMKTTSLGAPALYKMFFIMILSVLFPFPCLRMVTSTPCVMIEFEFQHLCFQLGGETPQGRIICFTYSQQTMQDLWLYPNVMMIFNTFQHLTSNQA